MTSRLDTIKVTWGRRRSRRADHGELGYPLTLLMTELRTTRNRPQGS